LKQGAKTSSAQRKSRGAEASERETKKITGERIEILSEFKKSF